MTKKRARKKSQKPRRYKAAKTPSLRLLLADDIAIGAENDSRSRAVRLVAGRLAALIGASLDVVHVEDSTYYPVRDPTYAHLFERYASDRKARLKIDGLVPPEVPFRSLLVSGSPVPEILKLAGKRHAYELLVAGTQGRRGLDRLLVGSVAEELVRRSRVPVMTVGPLAQENAARIFADEGKPRSILVPTSLTKNSARAEAFAYQLAKKIGAELILFHAIYDNLHPVIQSYYGLPLSTEAASFATDLKEAAGLAVAKKAEAFRRRGVPVRALLDSAYHSSGDAVLAQAAKGATLIVMGTHGRSLIAGAFLGRTARGVILGASVPVVTVRSRSA